MILQAVEEVEAKHPEQDGWRNAERSKRVGVGGSAHFLDQWVDGVRRKRTAQSRIERSVRRPRQIGSRNEGLQLPFLKSISQCHFPS